LEPMEVDPGGRLAVGERARVALADARRGERLGGRRGGGRVARAEAVDDRDRHLLGDIAPILPKVKLGEIVGAHDPDETHRRKAAREPRDGVGGEACADRGFKIGDVDAWVRGHLARARHALGKRRKHARVFERVAGRDEPPHAVEPEPAHGEEAHRKMRLMRWIERAAEQPDLEPRRVRRKRTHGRIWPDPRTRYLKLVSCSTPTGPRACMRPVAMPISAPKPNSPPSANWVEALCSTIAESTSLRNFSAAAASAVTIASV